MEETTTKEFIALIQEWGVRTKVSVNGKLGAQALKFCSEYSEYQENVDTGKTIIDDLGDMSVVLVMIAGLSNIDPLSVLTPDNSQAPVIGKTEALIGRRMGLLTDGVLKGNNLEVAIKLVYRDILEVARRNNLMIRDCLAHAYNDIKDREGIMTSSGVFVKSTDAEYERILAEEA